MISFFVLSGFLYRRNFNGLPECKQIISATFYIRRFCRIFPLYFLWLGLFIILVQIFTLHMPAEWCSTVFLSEIPHFSRWEYAVFLQNFYTAKTSLFGPTLDGRNLVACS